MRGFLLGVLVLTGGYVLLQTGSSTRIEAGGKVATAVFGRLADPTVAGIRQSLGGAITSFGPVTSHSTFTVPYPSGGGGGGGKPAVPNALPTPAPSGGPVLFT